VDSSWIDRHPLVASQAKSGHAISSALRLPINPGIEIDLIERNYSISKILRFPQHVLPDWRAAVKKLKGNIKHEWSDGYLTKTKPFSIEGVLNKLQHPLIIL
jgi:hypothetical protein